MVELSKGANAQVECRRITSTLSWVGSLEVDASALLIAAGGKVRSDDDFVFYNQAHHRSGAVVHLGKVVGRAARDSLGIDLGLVEEGIERIVLAASVYGGSFGQLTGLTVSISDAADDRELLRFVIASATVETAMLAGELYRRNGQWKFRAVGQGYESGLRGVANDFGITVEEAELVPEVVTTAQPVSTSPVVVPSAAIEVRGPQLPSHVVPPPGPNTSATSEDAEVTLRPFATDNPYLRKLFTLKEYGRAPGRALEVYRERVIDPDEKLLAAFKSQHGRLRWGYLILTTEYLRWIQTMPRQDEEIYQYTDRIEQEGTMIRLPTGDQFQLKGFGAGRKFKAIFRLAQQADLWQPR